MGGTVLPLLVAEEECDVAEGLLVVVAGDGVLVLRARGTVELAKEDTAVDEVFGVEVVDGKPHIIGDRRSALRSLGHGAFYHAQLEDWYFARGAGTIGGNGLS